MIDDFVTLSNKTLSSFNLSVWYAPYTFSSIDWPVFTVKDKELPPAEPSVLLTSILPLSSVFSASVSLINLNFSGNLFIFGDRQIWTYLVGLNIFISVVIPEYKYVLLSNVFCKSSLTLLINPDVLPLNCKSYTSAGFGTFSTYLSSFAPSMGNWVLTDGLTLVGSTSNVGLVPFNDVFSKVSIYTSPYRHTQYAQDHKFSGMFKSSNNLLTYFATSVLELSAHTTLPSWLYWTASFAYISTAAPILPSATISSNAAYFWFLLPFSVVILRSSVKSIRLPASIASFILVVKLLRSSVNVVTSSGVCLGTALTLKMLSLNLSNIPIN